LQRPVRAIVRLFRIPESLQFEIDRLLAEFYQPTYSPAEGYSPSLTAVLFPVSSDDRGLGKVPAIGNVVIDEVLKKQ